MTSRRDVIKGGVGAAALTKALGAKAVLAGIPGGEAAIPRNNFHSIIYDEGHDDSLRFGEAAKALGYDTSAIRGDITQYWFRTLDPLWKQSPVAIAGLTAPGPLFVLERLAWEKGLHVAFRAEHKPLAWGIRHKLAAPEGLSPDLRQADWAQVMAALVSRCPLDGAARHTLHQDGQCYAAKALPEDGLVSWIIAPRARTSFPRT